MTRAGALLGLAGLLVLAACAAPVSAPPESARASAQAPGGASQARQVLPIAATETAARLALVPTPTPESGAPLVTPLAPTVSPIAPALPTLTLAPRPQLDAGSQAALPAVLATATAQAANALATAQALPAQEITIRDLAFTPANVTVKPGTTIVWRNFDRVQHQVKGGEFDSGRIQAAGQWAQIIGRPGLYQFVCSFHPSMRAEVTVSPDDTRPLHLGN